MTELLGLIAGDGDFPLEIARGARRRGRRVHAVAFRGLTRDELVSVTDGLTWLHLGEVDALLGSLRAAGVDDVVLAGKVDKSHLSRGGVDLHLDARARSLLGDLGDHRDASILALVARVLEEQGMTLRPQVEWVPELVLAEGVLGAVAPATAQWSDILLGLSIARRLAADEVGQCVVMKGGATVAVEAMEGTDATIARAAALVGPGFSAVKVAGPRQDPRFDVPVIGPQTIHRLIEGGAAALAVEAGACVVLHRDEVVRLADAAGIALVGVVPTVASDGRGGLA